jgi:hypothetical protein
MGKKTLIPEEKWEGLRHAMEEAAGTRKTSKSTGLLPPAAEGEAARPERGKKRGATEEGKKERTGEKEKEKKKTEKKKKKGKKGKGKKKKNGKKNKKGKG